MMYGRSRAQGLCLQTTMSNTYSFITKAKRLFCHLLLAFLIALDVRRIFSLRALTVKTSDRGKVRELIEFTTIQNWFFAAAGSPDLHPMPQGDLAPTLGFVRFTEASVCANPRHSSIIQAGSLYLEPNGSNTTPRITVSDPPLAGHLYYFKETLLANVTHVGGVAEGIYVGSKSPHNWYHWIVDTLPAVYLSRFLPSEYQHFPLLLPELGPEKLHWIETLAAANPGRKIITLERDNYIRVTNLIWVHSPTVRREEFPTGLNASLAMESQAMLAYRNHMMRVLAPDLQSGHTKNRIFLARNQSGLRPYNQEEILEIAKDFGFRPLHLESMELAESIELIANAQYIIGPHGAAWASAIFATSAQAALLWTWDEALNENWFHNVLGLQNTSCTTLLTGPGDNNSAYVLPPEKFRAALIRMLGEGNEQS